MQLARMPARPSTRGAFGANIFASSLYKPTTAVRWQMGPAHGKTNRRFVGENPKVGAPIFYSLTESAQKVTFTVRDIEASEAWYGRVLGLVRAFVAAGAKVALADIQDDAGGKLAAEFGPQCAFVHADLRRDDDIDRLVTGTAEQFGGIVEEVIERGSAQLDILCRRKGVAPLSGERLAGPAGLRL